MKANHIELPFKIAAGAPMPEVSSDEHDLTIKVYELHTDLKRQIKFNSFLIYTFGWPNEEIFSQHKYADLEIGPFDFCEIEESDWIEDLRQRNSHHPHHQDKHFSEYRHFVLGLHDTTLEVVAKDFEVLHKWKV